MIQHPPKNITFCMRVNGPATHICISTNFQWKMFSDESCLQWRMDSRIVGGCGHPTRFSVCDWNIRFSVETSFVSSPFIKKETQTWQSGVVLIWRRHGVLVLCWHPQDNYPCRPNTIFWNRRTNPEDDTRILSTNNSKFQINTFTSYTLVTADCCNSSIWLFWKVPPRTPDTPGCLLTMEILF